MLRYEYVMIQDQQLFLYEEDLPYDIVVDLYSMYGIKLNQNGTFVCMHTMHESLYACKYLAYVKVSMLEHMCVSIYVCISVCVCMNVCTILQIRSNLIFYLCPLTRSPRPCRVA